MGESSKPAYTWCQHDTRNLAVEFEAPRKNCRQLNYKHTGGKLIYTLVSLLHSNKQHCYILITISLSIYGKKKLLKRQIISFLLYLCFL